MRGREKPKEIIVDFEMLDSDDVRRIIESPDILIGKPTLRGTRISVTQVLLSVARTGSVAQTAQQLQDVVPPSAGSPRTPRRRLGHDAP